MSLLHVNEARLWDSLMRMGEIGALPGGGCCRLALSAEDGAGRDLFVKWCREAGCDVTIDQVGNIFARRRGKRADAPAVATGSHLDTQPHGGKFDGIYGVLAGLEVVRTLNGHNVETDLPIDVVVWTNEEASRFHPPLTGSSAFVGAIDAEFVHDLVTVDGSRVKDDLLTTGYLGTEVPGARILESFLEVHIEQGPILEAEGLTIGVVTQVQGLRFSSVRVRGEDGHGGTVPMVRRRDAMMGAAKMIAFLDRLARSSDERIRLTVGYLQVSPNSASTIPGEVRFTIDLRHPDADYLLAVQAQIDENLQEIAAETGLGLNIKTEMHKEPVHFDLDLLDLVQRTADSLKLPNRRMLSGAGHDAMNLARIAPTAMIFVPCEKGISHNESESATPADIAAGADVLLNVMLARACAEFPHQ